MKMQKKEAIHRDRLFCKIEYEINICNILA